jgi:hypothetical protein
MTCPHCGGEIEFIASSAAVGHGGFGVPETGHRWEREWRAYDQALESLDRKVAEVSELNRLLKL